ncbi:putative ribonuclease e inhibitor rraa dimethylmenaquinone methyltransferase protein [Phaeoacremonium minimum UCRPA7]|uniref:Putative ribonuclease e inhibitor rraa dimethylmenaquinone methyltransferase protein n=1 Tax=Phaeoacremonium minimum (strain UCR-PA7) TaxID=1286976 RepID=R8BPP3_PHAM7|nr:putative ribonuclease e inhibitor rraa dimethylmenaquinone methyltransferase protein [Phaeoacremonium minimum UCRPA7]EOO01270.1 putative ribonuclease e inhibitor rraa dimethylmenaquinone methyltransferase protein [Phaeoacremonium minimum UCRPA7]
MASQDPIVKALQEYTACDVSDALCKLKYRNGGFLSGLTLWSPQRQEGDTKIVGPAYTVKYAPLDDPTPKHPTHYIDSVPEGAVVFVSCPPKTPNAVYGGLMSARAQASKAVGSVIDGRFRDLQEQRDLNFPIFARDVGTAPPYELVKVVGVNVPVKLQTDEQDMTINPGDYIIGDLNGVVVLPKNLAEQALPLMAKQVEADSQMAVEIKKGFGAAEALADVGAIVTIISSSQENIDKALGRLNNPKVQGRVGDVRDEEAFTQLLVSLAPLDHIVFSGVDKIIRGPLAEANLDEAKHLFGVKFWGSIVVGKALAKHDIISPGGSLTLTSGGAAFKPGKGAAIGGALNGGVVSLTKGLANELADKRIRVNTVVPGLVKTELWDKLGHSKEKQEEIFNKGSKDLSVGFVATPTDIAEAYLYTVRADYANGTLVVIDGGSQI